MAERSFAREVEDLKLGAGEVFRGEGILAITKALLQSGVSYVGGVDGAGGSAGGDSFTASVSHFDRAAGYVVVDAVREIRPPFSPEAAVAEISKFFKSYGVKRIFGDRWGSVRVNHLQGGFVQRVRGCVKTQRRRPATGASPRGPCSPPRSRPSRRRHSAG